MGEFGVGPYGYEDSVLNSETLDKIYLGTHFFDFGAFNKYDSGLVLVAKGGKVQILSSLLLEVSKAYYGSLKKSKKVKLAMLTRGTNVRTRRTIWGWE
ncbi:hypothetical protein [Lishizhenia tianjinensis]|uniref:hypothetical protein n=1 Tax=Lishizhenia tianjinensis TaxID=477690 RepID=UPI000B7FAEF6|nr:hypothetical protein [Lishizhenia tianjinensis]